MNENLQAQAPKTKTTTGKRIRHKKTEAFHAERAKWLAFNKKLPDGTSIIPIPLIPDTKRPIAGKHGVWDFPVLYSADHPVEKRWDMKKSLAYPWDDVDCDLGVLISGDAMVLDFDAQADMDWFIGKFDINPSDYLVVGSADKHTGGHLYIQGNEYLKNITRQANGLWLSDDAENPHTLDIDLKKEWRTGTPALVKVPMGGGEREKKRWIKDKRMKEEKTLQPLPDKVYEYLQQNEYVPPSMKKAQTTKTLVLEVANLIPKDTQFKQNDWCKCICELMVSNVPFDDIYRWSNNLTQSKNPENRVPHKKYLEDFIKSVDTNTLVKDVERIHFLAQNHAGGDYAKFMTNYAEKNTTTAFDKNHLQRICRHVSDFARKKTIIKDYYDRFFAYTTGQQHDCVLCKEYMEDGRIKQITEKDLSKFHQYCSFKTILDEDAKATSTSQFWFDRTSNTFNKVEFIPYGIVEKKYNPHVFNSFTGFRMEYVPEYVGTKRENAMGDMINAHLRDILGAGDDYSYQYSRAWLYNLICRGQRSKVMWVLYSKEFGAGKSVWVGNMAKFCLGVGRFNVSNNFNKLLNNDFTEAWDDKSLLIFEEMPEYSHKCKENWDIMKSRTDDDMSIKHHKHKGASFGENWYSCIAITNHDKSICPEFAVRRGNLQEVSGERVGDVEYMEELHACCSSYEGWRDFVHRYLIQSHDEFKNINLASIANLIPQTPLRKRVLSQRIDNMLLFFADLLTTNPQFCNMDCAEGEDPHEPIYGKRLSATDLWSAYQSFVASKHLDGWISNEVKFHKELERTLGEQIKETYAYSKEDKCMMSAVAEKGSLIKRKRTNKCSTIVFEKQMVQRILKACRTGGHMEEVKNVDYVCEDEIMDDWLNHTDYLGGGGWAGNDLDC